MKNLISKSKFVSFCQCPKSFYLQAYHPELADISSQAEKRLKSGTSIGDLARQIFGDYVDVTTYNGDYLDLKMMIEKTQNELKNNTTNICEASFLNDDLYCAVDILHKSTNGYKIYEVKSTTHVKDYHVIDSAFQYYVLSSLGLNIESVNIITLDSKYVRGPELEINKLFKIHDITEKAIGFSHNIKSILADLRACKNNNEIPNIGISKKCDDPFECSFKKYCFKDIPYPSVFDLANCQKKYTYYNEGIITFNDLANSNYYKKLSKNFKLQISHEIENKEMKVDKASLNEFLSEIRYPLYLLDFESMMPALPLFEGTSPYQQITFQYSLHIIESKGATPIHKEFLATEGVNPTYDLALSLINDIPRDASIMAFNTSYEIKRIQELATMYPSLKDELDRRLNFVDLMYPFQKKIIYKKEFQGSYSIKYVLPGLFPNDPELDYHNLDIIHNGGEAMTMYENILAYEPEERLKIREALLAYCKLDTYAMVKILSKLYELSV